LAAVMTGTIRTLRVDKGFGFIKDDAGKEYFFQSAVYGEGLDNLREGD
jgi:cold shock CspA family protein